MIKIFSRSIRRQLLTTDLSYALVSNLLNSGQLKYRELKCAQRIEARLKKIKFVLYGETESLILSKKHLRQYGREVNRLLCFVDAMDVGSSQLRGLEFFNSVLLVVSDVRVQALRSKSLELKREWLLIDQMLNTLYRYADLELDNFNAMYAGKLYGEAIMEII